MDGRITLTRGAATAVADRYGAGRPTRVNGGLNTCANRLRLPHNCP